MPRQRSLALLFVSLTVLQFTVIVSTSQFQRANQDTEGSADARNLKLDQEGAHEVHCSRERSRTASKIIEEYLRPFVEKEKYQLSTKCRLHHENDMFRDQEQHKRHLDINEWQCGYCRKRFYEERYLDLHLDNRHYDLLNVSHGKCLADLCGALHCDAAINSVKQKTRCNPAAAARNRHLCESLADNCFPVSEGSAANRLHEFFLRQFCDAHTCSGSQKPFSRGRRKGRSIFRLIISFLLVLLLPLLYLFIYLHRRGMKRGTQDLRRISHDARKKKPS